MEVLKKMNNSVGNAINLIPVIILSFQETYVSSQKYLTEHTQKINRDVTIQMSHQTALADEEQRL